MKSNHKLEKPIHTSYTLHLIDETRRPFILICPGGGYTHLAYEKEGLAIQTWLNEAGYHTGILTYQVQNIHYKTLLSDIEKIMSELRSHPALKQIFVLGFSAGAHVAGLIGSKISPRPDGLLLAYPVVSFIEPFSHRGSWQNLLGETASFELRSQFSLERIVDENTPPCFIWHTITDQAVPVENSLCLVAALKAKQVSVECHLFPEGQHGLGILPEVPHLLQWQGLAENWLKERQSQNECD